MINFVKRTLVMKLKQHLAKADTAEQYLALYCVQGHKLKSVIKLIGSFLFCEITIPNEV